MGLFCLILVQLLAIGVSAHVCGFVPPHILEHIRDSPANGYDIRQSANRTLQHLASIHNQRNQRGNGNGIVSTGDDDNLPEEQDPANLGNVLDEYEAYLAADEGDADSTSGEPPPTKRSTRGKRQSSASKRFIYNKAQSCKKTPPGTLVRKEGTPVAADSNVNTIYEYFGFIDNFYRTQFGRNGIDNKGGRMHGMFTLELISAPVGVLYRTLWRDFYFKAILTSNYIRLSSFL
jgi:hypothetical protein